MANLHRGENAPLPVSRVVATVSCAVPVDVSALLVAADLRVRTDDDLVFYNAPQASGVRWNDSGGGQRIEAVLTEVPADVHAVLVAISLTGGGSFGSVPAPVLTLQSGADPGGTLATFRVDGLGPETAIVGLELYRRGEGWKVRAVGQGYAGGLAELVTAHGVEVDDPGEPMSAASPPDPAFGAPVGAASGDRREPPGHPRPTMPLPAEEPPGSAPPGSGPAAATGPGRPRGHPPGRPAGTPGGPPAASAHEVGYAERAWLVWEDASRSLAAFRAATEHALALRGEEVSGQVPKGRYSRLIDAATARLNADMQQLREELAGTEAQVAPEVAPFTAANWLAWRPRADLAEAILVGRLTADAALGLRVPLVLRMPWRRAIWISSGILPGDAPAFAWSLVTRFMAAVPPGTAGVEVIDATGRSGAGWLGDLDPAAVHHLLGGGPATGPAAGRRLRGLLDLVDLRRLGLDDAGPRDATGPMPTVADGPPIRLVVVFDAATALAGSDDADQLLRLVEDGPLVGIPVILVESDRSVEESVRIMRVRQSCHNFPSEEGAIADPWVGADWTIIPDVLPDAEDGSRPPSLLAHVLSEHARALSGP